jgi:hypothetical protein
MAGVIAAISCNRAMRRLVLHNGVSKSPRLCRRIAIQYPLSYDGMYYIVPVGPPNLPSGDSVFAMHKDIDLTNPKLGAELLMDAKGELPVDVWMAYFWQHSDEWKPVLAWCVDPDDPDFAPIDPQQAVDQAEPLVAEVIHFLPGDPQKALEAARRAVGVLVHGSSEYQRGRGQAPRMQHLAVRAWLIRKFNPHPQKPGESAVSWAKLADLLFLENGKCPRKIRNKGTTLCGVPRHQYDSPCVKSLMTAVRHLQSAMKHDGIPL